MVDVTIIPPPIGPQFLEADGTAILFQVDCGVSYLHSQAAQVSEHPIERGSEIADHRQLKRARLKLEGISSARPLIAPAAESEAIEGTGYEHLDAFDRLLDLFMSEVVLDVVTPKRFYRSMVMTSLSVPDDASKASVTEFSVELMEVAFVRSETVKLKPRPGVRTEKVGRGKQPTAEAPAGAASGSKSALSDLFSKDRLNSIGGAP